MTRNDHTNIQNEQFHFLAGGGEMGALIRATDWSKTSLGCPAGWPQSLRTMVSVMLDNPFGMYIAWGPDYIQLYNDGYRPILGANKHPQALGISTRETFSEIWHIIGSMFEDVMKGKATGFPDFMLPLNRNGFIEECYFDFSYSPIRKEDGEVGGILVTVIETTGKKKAQEALQESKDQLLFAIEASELGTWDYNPVTNKFSCNQRLKDWFGLPADTEVDLADAVNVICSKDRQRVTTAIHTALQFESGGVYEIEHSIINPKSKKEIILLAKGKTWFNNDKEAYRFTGTLENITHKVQSGKKMEESEELLRIALQGGELGTFDYYPDTDQLTWSDKTKEFFGYPPDEVMNYSKYINTIHPDDRENSKEIATQLAKLGKTGLYEIEYRVIQPNSGLVKWIRSKGKATCNEDGIPVRYTGVVQDITRQKLSESALKVSEEKFRTMAESSDILIGVNDETTHAVYFNKKWEDFTGLPVEALYKLGWADLLHPDDRQSFLDKFAAAVKNKVSYDGEFRILNKYGTYSWLYTKVPVRLNPDGSYAGHISSSIDITERKQAEDELKKQEQRLRSFVDSAPFPIGVYVGREMRIEMVNDSILQAWDRTRDVVGQLYADTLPELAGQGVYEQLDAVFTTGLPFHATNQYLELMVDGKIQPYYYNYSFTPLYDEEGNIYGVMNTAANVTELNMAKLKIEETEKRFRNTVKQAPIGITILRGMNYNVEMANDAYLQITGRTETEFVGRSLFESLPEVEATVRPLLDDVMDTGEPFHGIEYPIPINRYGKSEISYFNFLYHPLKEEDGTISGILVTVTDVGETVRAKISLAESEKRFRNMVEHSPVAMAILRGRNFVVEIANKTLLEKFWQKKADDILGKELLTVMPELKTDQNDRLLNTVFESGMSYAETGALFEIKNINGISKFYMDFEYAPLFDSDLKVSGIMITANDVSGQVEARKKVEDSEKEFRELANSLPELVWTTDPFGNQTFASRRWKEFTGLDPYDHTSFEKIIHPNDLRPTIQLWTSCLASGNIYKTQLRLKKNDGEYEWFYVHGEPVRDENGTIKKWIGSFTNFNEQKKVEQELVNAFLQIEESEKRFRNVANSAPVLIWMSGTDQLRYFFNTAWLEFTGHRMEDENGNGWAKGIHPEDFKKCIAVYMDAFDKKAEYYMEYRLRRADGEYRWLSDKGAPRFTAEGIFEGFIGACMDIHERVVYQKKLKEDEERLNIIINASELGTWELNLKTDKVQFSERFLEIMGHDPLVPASHNEMMHKIHPDDLPGRNEAFRKGLISGSLHFEIRIIWPDQSLHWIENKGKVFYNEDGDPVNIVGTTRDITEEKYYQQELEEREQKFRLLADAMPEFVWTGDQSGNLNYFNQSLFDYSGLSNEEIQKDGWLQIIHPDDREENIRLWMESVQTGRDFLFEHRFRRQDSEYRWHLSRAIPQKDQAGNIQMWVGTSADINEIKEQDQQKDLFISMASHELKTPVTSIKGYIQILQSMYEKSPDHFLKDSLYRVDKQIVTLTKLIAELLDLSKIKSGNLFLNREIFSMNKLVSEIIDGMMLINTEKKIHFYSTWEPVVNADRDRIGQVLINFLTNAIKYAPDADEIKVTSVVKDRQVLVSVEDAGIGINKTDQEKIFQRFYRVEGKNEKTYPGFGIGLFIAAEIIYRHQGEIGVKSEPGKGSCFYFSLPLIKAEDNV